MRNYIIVVGLILLVIVGLPLFLNFENTGDILGGQGSVITAIAASWLELFSMLTSGVSSSGSGTPGRF